MTDTQADLTERARAVAVRIVQTDFGDEPLDPITLMMSWIAAFAQSEREAVAAEARRTLNLVIAQAGIPDPQEACRIIIATCKRALASPAPQEETR